MTQTKVRLIGATIAALALLGGSAGTAGAKTATVELRVLTEDATLEQGTRYVVGREQVRTDPGAQCNFGGAGGSGERYRFDRPTALGLLRGASRSNARLRPLSITDEFGFGLAVCGIGEADDSPGTFWNLRKNHRETSKGADLQGVSSGDEILFYLAPDSFPDSNVPELELRVAPRANPGLVDVSVIAHQCAYDSETFAFDCGSVPAEGATVWGGDFPVVTGPDGRAQVSVSAQRAYRLRAEDDPSIPSKVLEVCVDDQIGRCPVAQPRTIVGRVQPDRIRGGRGDDEIRAGRGGDVIRIANGGNDKVRCGAGRDKVIRKRGDGADELRGCERVVVRRS